MDLESLMVLKGLAARYIWWKTPAEAMERPERVIAQVMDIGDYGDVQRLAAALGDDAFMRVLERAEPGWFSPRSWAYWHYRLGLARLGALPPTPSRSFG
jgi:hypothetical protein